MTGHTEYRLKGSDGDLRLEGVRSRYPEVPNSCDVATVERAAVIEGPWPEQHLRSAKRAKLRGDTSLSDWFVGYGKDRSCQFEGKWWHHIVMALRILSSHNTRIVAETLDRDDFYHPEFGELANDLEAYTGAPYSFIDEPLSEYPYDPSVDGE
ncbi:hypothetical protein [Halomarina oriensis]|uniref:Uncharacterized protein n=1 Tax=Halomarina oriensis TaxID=671145 RepID=A0A6B0GV47_9EURY|nr:hypothetical protein [Halomarina oriensis]MWG36453.1 hypothetical protein [Halomarina oriensis]